VFSAAFVAQPGTNHINTHPHSFWAKNSSSAVSAVRFFLPEVLGQR
jgi:hypothetical protein